MSTLSLLYVYALIGVCNGAEILLGGAVGDMSVHKYSCAMDCAEDDSCVGITVTAPTCQLHHGDYAAAQYKRQDCKATTHQVPSTPLEDDGSRDNGKHFMVLLEPFQQNCILHTVNFYAGQSAPFRVHIVDALDSAPNQVLVRKTIEINGVSEGYNSKFVEKVEVTAGQYVALYWGTTWAVKKTSNEGAERVAFKVNIEAQSDGDVVNLVHFQTRNYQIRVLCDVCRCDSCL